MHNAFFDSVMVVVSEKWFSLPFVLIALILIYQRFGWKKTLLVFLGAAACVGLADFISTRCFKYAFERYRPSHNLELEGMVHLVNNYRGGMFGFVSSHSANMFALFLFLGLWLKKKWLWIGLCIAALIAYSRIYLGVHYPSDVIVGGMLGGSIGFLIFLLFRKICSKLES